MSARAPILSIDVVAATEELAHVREIVRRHAAGAGFRDREVSEIELAVDEAFTNIIKHAQATAIHAYVRYSATVLHIVIIDNGIGFQELEMQHGMGLPGMRRRAERSGIALTLRSATEVGTTVELIMPFEGVT